MSESLREILERYTKAYDEREAGIGEFLDDEGELKEGNSYEAYDEHCYESWSDSHGDLGSLLAELADVLGMGLKVGDRVKVDEEAETANGCAVFFDGEIEGEIVQELDRDGDVQVKSDDGVTQWVGVRYVKRIKQD
ncbi:hypothetical protein [Streptomyces collinus]|uniref:hypothetical protein n=1 Tax=Streptomyces collinus TaxID=42684 RepID=UPI00379678AA